MKTFIIRLLAASILASCNIKFVTPVSSEPVARFHSSGWKFVSLNEQDIRDVLRLDLSNYRMPDDLPFVFNENALYLKVMMGDSMALVETDFAIPKNCTPSRDLTKLLCASPNDISIKDLSPEVQSAAISIFLKYGGEYKDYFVITIGNPEIYTLPRNKFQYNTGCRWTAKDRIECVTSHGTGVWTTVIFDLQSKKYLPLLNDGANIWDDSNFNRGYIQLRFSGTTDERVSIYNLTNIPLYGANAKDWTTTEDTVVVIEPCDSSSVCLHYLQFDGQGITRDLSTKLGVVVDDTSPSYIAKTSEGFVVTVSKKVFLIDGDTLQVTQALDFPQPEQTWFDLYKVIVQKYGHLLIAQAHPFYDERGLLEADRSVIVFDLDKCRGILDQSCAVKTWDKSFKLSENSNMYLTLRHIYYSRTDSPNLVYIYDEDPGNFAIYNLDDASENNLHLGGVIDSIASSVDGRFLLVATKADDVARPETRHYYLIDLAAKRVIDTKMNVDENLFFVRERV